MADQVQFQGSAQSLGFKPIEQVNALPLIKENHQRFLQAEQTKFELEQTYAKTRQFVDNNNIQSLADFSSTLSDMLVEETKKQNERDMEEGVMQAYLDGVDPAESMAFDIAEGYLKTNDDQLQTIGDAAQASGAPFMGVQKLRELSGWKAYGYAMGMAQNAGTAYAAYMEEALANVPMDADPSEKAVYLSNARAQFLKQSGLMGMNPALLNKYAFPSMREADSVFLNRWRKQQEEEIKGQMIDEAQTVIGADPVGNFTKAMDMMVRGGMDRRKARTELLGMMSPDELNSLAGTVSWDGKLTWEEKYPNDFRLARRNAIQGEVSDYESEQAAAALEGKQWFDQVQEMWEQNPPTDQEIAEAERYMSDNFNYVDGRLGERWKSRSTDAEAKQYYDQQFDQLERAGQLTEAMLNDPAVPSDVRRRYLATAQQQDKARRETPEFKQYTKQIEADLKRHSGQETLDTISAPGYELALAAAETKFQRDMMAAVAGGASPAEAASIAYANFQQDLQNGANGVGQYTIDPENGFTRLIPTATGSGWQKHKAAIDNILTAGVTTLDSHALIPKSTLQEAIKNINSPNYVYPAIATYISDRFGGAISPWEVLNRQAKAQGLGELPMNPRLQSQTQGMRPEFVRMLHYRPTYNRVTRAYASVGNFNPDMVPKGYGNAIAQAGAKYGIPPSILAGLIEVESGFNPNARSRAGAVGIAQIMPGYHPTVDPTNALASIDYAAKYLSELQAQLGSLDEAIYAYNGGPGGIRKSAENRAYHPLVMRAAAKYGYNPTGGSPWQNPALLNPRVAYITGDIMPGGARSEHLDIKQADGGRFAENALDRYVEIEDPQFGRVAPSTLRAKLPGRGDNFDQHVARGSHGIDYPTANGSKVFLKGGAKVISSQATEWGDKLTIQLPNGKRYTFLHGRSA